MKESKAKEQSKTSLINAKAVVKMWKEESGAEASVRYGPRTAGDVCWRIYVRKEAYEKLGKPDEIRVTIEAGC